MDIGEGGELIFSTEDDHTILNEILYSYRSIPLFSVNLEKLAPITNKAIGIEPTNEVSAEHLQALLDEAEREALGADEPNLPSASIEGMSAATSERIMRRAVLSGRQFSYILPKEWTAFILNGAYGLAWRAHIDEAEVHYLKSGEPGFHFLGMSDEVARELIAEAERLKKEEDVDILDTGPAAEAYAEEKLDKAILAAGVVMEITHKYGIAGF